MCNEGLCKNHASLYIAAGDAHVVHPECDRGHECLLGAISRQKKDPSGEGPFEPRGTDLWDQTDGFIEQVAVELLHEVWAEPGDRGVKVELPANVVSVCELHARPGEATTVMLDMNTAYDLEVRQHCPHARVVYDLFHVIAKYGREVISRVRVDAANQLRHDKPARRVVKRAHWLLLRNPANLKDTEQVRLAEVLEANQSLLVAYVMKDQLKALWNAPTAWAWRSAWTQWLRHARESGIPALMHFARCLRPYWRGILSRTRWPMHTGLVEGINNRIKVIKRIAYGYRDDAYFFLKIKAAFPGVGR